MAAEPHELLDDAGDGPFGPADPAATPITRTPRSRRSERAPKAAAQPDDDPGQTAERPPDTGKKRSRSGTTRAERKARARRSLASGVSTVLGFAADVATRAFPAQVPTARALGFVAPAAGHAVDQVVAGTIIDRALQPVAAKGDKVKTLGNIFALPAMVFAVSNRPELYPALLPMMREAVMANIVATGPVLVEKKKQDAEAARVLQEMAAEGMLPLDEHGQPPSIDQLVEWIFAPVPTAEPPAP